MKSTLGRSLIELLIALAAGTCLLTTGIPQISNLMDNMAQRSSANSLISALHFARHQAVTSKTKTSLCHGANTCTNDHVWQYALIVFTDLNGNGSIDDNDTILRSIYIAKGYTWRWAGFRSRSRLSYESDGTTLAMNGTFTLCKGSEPKSQIVVSLSGRPRIREPVAEAKCR